jgi:hypothetical protein
MEMGFFRKIKKNTTPFQAKAKLREAFIHMSVLAPGLKNTRPARNAAATIMTIAMGHIVSLYALTWVQKTSVLTIRYLPQIWSI